MDDKEIVEQLKRHNELLESISQELKRPQNKASDILALVVAVVSALGVFQVIDIVVKWVMGD
jgi:hypothetical protein